MQGVAAERILVVVVFVFVVFIVIRIKCGFAKRRLGCTVILHALRPRHPVGRQQRTLCGQQFAFDNRRRLARKVGDRNRPVPARVARKRRRETVGNQRIALIGLADEIAHRRGWLHVEECRERKLLLLGQRIKHRGRRQPCAEQPRSCCRETSPGSARGAGPRRCRRAASPGPPQ